MASAPFPNHPRRCLVLRDMVQELRELGLRGTAFRASWELKHRTGVDRVLARAMATSPPTAAERWTSRLPLPDAISVADGLRDRVSAESVSRLVSLATGATQGRILCFGRWMADFGSPIDWRLNPTNGQRWRLDRSGPLAFQDSERIGDVKLTWEVARFPHAFQIARAAAFRPELEAALATTLTDQIAHFIAENPCDRGIHWASGQEIAHRLFAWLFALDVLLARSAERARASDLVSQALRQGAEHIERHIDYARLAVYNNHLISEALALYAAGALLADTPDSTRWRTVGRAILSEQAERQFYPDGAYIQLSHNYHRSALQSLLWACLLARAGGERPDDAWLSALDRSLAFLVAHQNAGDGRLPNSGPNDGTLPAVLSTCDFSDFRPTLQAVAAMVRGQRLYEPGPWDEEAAWFVGPRALDLPLAPPVRRSCSFAQTGYHVLRGRDESSFSSFRCGSILDRFGQIDMLHVDVWWRGLNLLVDGGSFLYNASAEWHDLFMRTASHNTVVIDGRDQMLHYRRFKNLYWTRARLLGFEDGPEHAVCTGEHYGFARHPGGCVHRRSVLFVKDDLWVVADTIRGTGAHRVSLHWLASDPAARHDAAAGRITLDTPHGPFSVTMLNDRARPLTGNVVAGSENPPRGWTSRYYAEKQPAASFEAEVAGNVPITLLTLIGPGAPGVVLDRATFTTTGTQRPVAFRVTDGALQLVKS